MIDGKRVVALIPARGGSKRLPRKNVLPLAGKPLIGWSIDAAKRSRYVDDVVISTDDIEVATVSREMGIETPELRPDYLASDMAKTEDVLLYSLEKYGEGNVDIIILLQPTSPLRNDRHIDDALELFVDKQANSVVSVTPCEHSPMWSNTLPEDLSMGSFIKPEALQRSQDLDQFYRLNGALYIFDVSDLLKEKKIVYTEKTYAYSMENQYSFDIDTEFDFEIASVFLEKSLAIQK
ncbi:acylneuraminate cytidylyltransferase family protein [Vibrio splendidus]